MASEAPTADDSTAEESPTADDSAGDGATLNPELTPLRDQLSEPVPPAPSQDEAGAVAFLTYFMDVTNWTYATGDLALLEDACVEMTGYCDMIASGAQTLADDGLTLHGGLQYADVANVTVDAPSDGQTRITLDVITDEARVVDEDGNVQIDAPELVENVYFDLAWHDGEWKAVDSYLTE